MAYWINKSGNTSRPNWKQFYCDNTEDVAALPTSVAEGAHARMKLYSFRLFDRYTDTGSAPEYMLRRFGFYDLMWGENSVFISA